MPLEILNLSKHEIMPTDFKYLEGLVAFAGGAVILRPALHEFPGYPL